MIYIVLYLIAIVLANLSIYYFGASFIIISAFLFIGLDLTSRDKLHELWQHDRLFIKMLALILTGSLLTCLFSWGAWQIAFASFASFFVAGIVDTVVFNKLRHKSYYLRVNGSNIPSALVDSIMFPTIAFGTFLPWVILGQFLAKVLGGLFWSVVLRKVFK